MLGPSHKKENAEGLINRLRQNKSALEYAVTFQHYIAKNLIILRSDHFISTKLSD